MTHNIAMANADALRARKLACRVRVVPDEKSYVIALDYDNETLTLRNEHECAAVAGLARLGLILLEGGAARG